MDTHEPAQRQKPLLTAQVSSTTTDGMRSNAKYPSVTCDEGTLASGKLLTVQQVAGLLQVPPSWVYGRTRSRAADRIPSFRLGKYRRFRKTDVLNWLETQTG